MKGSEPAYPDPDARPLWQRAIVAVLMADQDLDQRRDWLELFPVPLTRRPDTSRNFYRTR